MVTERTPVRHKYQGSLCMNKQYFYPADWLALFFCMTISYPVGGLGWLGGGILRDFFSPFLVTVPLTSRCPGVVEVLPSQSAGEG